MVVSDIHEYLNTRFPVINLILYTVINLLLCAKHDRGLISYALLSRYFLLQNAGQDMYKNKCIITFEIELLIPTTSGKERQCVPKVFIPIMTKGSWQRLNDFIRKYLLCYYWDALRCDIFERQVGNINLIILDSF